MAKDNFLPGPLLYVEWWDHASGDAWQPEQNIRTEGLLIRSVGWLVKENKTWLILAMNDGSNGTTSCRMYIHKGCIDKRVKLKCPT